MKHLHINSIRAVAGDRPPGYEADLLATGQVTRDPNGDPVHVTFTDEAFASLVKKYSRKSYATDNVLKRGPGTELKTLLARVGITATPNCSCNAKAAEMDRQGIDWCEDNIDTIVAWLREEATKRGLPFLDVAGRMLIRRAIKNARKAAS